MAEIVPRWEWRTFGEDFGAAEEAFAALTVERVQESDELYLLAERERCLGQGPGRAHGRQAAAGGRRRRARAVGAGHEGRLPVGRRRRRRRARKPGGRRDAARPRRVHPRRARRRDRAPERRPAGRRRAQAARPLHRRRLRCRAQRGAHGERVDAHDRGRVRGSRPRAGGRALARARLARERLHGPRAQDARRLRDEPIRGDRRRHELGQAPRRRTARRRHVEHGRRPRRGDPPRRGPRRGRQPPAGADEADDGGDRRDGRRVETRRRRRDRGRRHRRVARSSEPGRVRQRGRGPLRRPDRGHLGQGGGPPRLPRGQVRARPRPRLARRLRHGRRQLPVHVRPWRRGRRSVQRARRCGAPDGALRARRDCLRRSARSGPRRDRRRARLSRRPVQRPTRSSGWAGR